QVHDPGQLGQIVVKYTPAGVPVKVADVASVAPAVKPVYTIVTANGKPAVLLSVNRQPDSNTVAVADKVHAEVERIRQSLPPGVHLEPFYDQSGLVVDSIHSVRDAILIGVILASLVAVLVIPATVFTTFIALKVLDQSFNLMTLGGLAAAVGLIIDDAIVVVENVALHRDAGQGRLQAIQSALGEITVPLIGSTITPIVVFLPLIAITGVTGVFFRALAITVAVSLFASLALALTWTPTLSRFFITEHNNESAPDPELSTENGDDVNERLLQAEERNLEGSFGRIIRFYEKYLLIALRRPLWLVAASILLILASAIAYRFIGSDL